MMSYLKTRQSSSARSSILVPFYQGGHSNFPLLFIFTCLSHQHSSSGDNNYESSKYLTHHHDFPHNSISKKGFMLYRKISLCSRFTRQGDTLTYLTSAGLFAFIDAVTALYYALFLLLLLSRSLNMGKRNVYGNWINKGFDYREIKDWLIGADSIALAEFLPVLHRMKSLETTSSLVSYS